MFFEFQIYPKKEQRFQDNLAQKYINEMLEDLLKKESFFTRSVITIGTINEIYDWTREGLFRKLDKGKVKISNFYPEVTDVLDTQEGKEVILKLIFISGIERKVTLPINDLNRMDWFILDTRCIVNDDIKGAHKYLKQLVRLQIAEYENSIAKITQYTELGWNYNAYGNAVYVLGNGIIGGTGNERISPALAEYKLQVCDGKQEEMLKIFVDLFSSAPPEGRVSILYFFTGLIKSLYKEAGVPVDFVFYIFGEQQSRKTTLVKYTHNLYNRDSDMDFSLRTVSMISEAMVEKLISVFKDTTLILDDLSMTKYKQYQQKQERIMEYVIRMLGNKSRKSSNVGNNAKDYFPNANVTITGEYLPSFPESTLSRMLIMEIKNPVDSVWLTAFGKEPMMLSTVAYSFLEWIQKDYSKYVDIIRKNFEQYCEKRKENPPYQERIYEHEFIMTCTSSLLENFLTSNGFIQEARHISMQNICALQDLIKRQIELMEETKLKGAEKDFCRVFAEYYMKNQYIIEINDFDKKEPLTLFMLNKDTICISTSVMLEIMIDYYKDFSITVQAITKQLKANHFLITDNSKQSKSTKKVGNKRYLHISKEVVTEYYEYCCH